MDYDVIIVGAGISGLYSGKLLKESGVNLIILEGRNRIAGRQWTHRADNIGYTDMGAAFIGKQQTKVMDVLTELGLFTYKVHCDLKSTLCLKDIHMQYESGIPSFSNIMVLMDLNHCSRLVDSMSLQVPIDAPWEAEKAELWDSMSVADFLEKTVWSKEAKVLGNVSVTSPFGVEASEMSLLYFLHEVRCCGGFKALVSIPDGLQEMKILGGSGQISDRLANSLKGQIKLNQLVTQVTEIEGGVKLTTNSGQTFTAKRAIFSVPLPGLHDIEFTPALPNYIQELSAIQPMCHMYKTFMFYDKAFWREHGLNAEMISEDGIVTYAVDDTKPDGQHPVILGFIFAEKAKRYSSLSPDERKALICEQYASGYGLEEFLHPTDYVEMYWQSQEEQKYGRGSCVWALPPGLLTKLRRLPSPKHPLGHIFLAGTESAVTFRGYMDGALRSAQCAAAEVSRSLGKEFDYDEKELSREVPYLPYSTLEKYLPNPTVFVALVALVPSIAASLLLYCRLF